MYNNPFYNNFQSSPIPNPMGDYYKSQLQQIQQAPQFSMQQNYQQPMQPRFTVNQVTSIDEARNQMVDPLVTSLYVNAAEGKIYLKRLNNQGTSDFLIFSLEQSENKTDPLLEINNRLKSIEAKLGEKHESTANVTVNNESSSELPTTNVKPTSTAESTVDE